MDFLLDIFLLHLKTFLFLQSQLSVIHFLQVIDTFYLTRLQLFEYTTIFLLLFNFFIVNLIVSFL